MTPASYDITIYEGAEYELTMLFEISDGVPVDLTGMVFSMKIRDELTSATSEDWSSYISHGSTNGTITLAVPAAETIDWGYTTGVYDIEFLQTDGKIYKLMRGNVTIVEEVTRTDG